MSSQARPLIVVMGVSGTGKSHVGRVLAARLACPYHDGDDLHSAGNIAKMCSGTPLTDEDRWPWLERVARFLAGNTGSGAVISCSALKCRYRDLIRSRAPTATFVHLTGTAAIVAQRMVGRAHFMPAGLLDSQLRTLQPLRPHERGIEVDIAASPDQIVEHILAALPRSTSPPAD